MRERITLRSVILTSASLLAFGLPATAASDGVAPATETGAKTATVTKSAETSSAQRVINTFRNRATGRCLDDSGAGLRSFPCNGLSFQKWNVTVDDFGHRTIQNQNTGRCLDDSGAGLRTFPCNGLTFQKWNVTHHANGITLANHETKRCVDDSNVGLRSFPCNGLNFQRWY
ncbi:RICIN domain-containing protein [Thermopolyspora sp. NPDC052614]|uniref:RICIN domain-containing protein n=1 Tax=Thermopolyspora sp. NPDC052614 TaxID=3155682 RepID=UPI00343EC01E